MVPAQCDGQGLSPANHQRRRMSFLNIVRRRNTIEQLQVVADHIKRKGEEPADEASFSHMYEDNHRPVKREIVINKQANEPFGAGLFVYRGAVFVAYVLRDSPAFRAGLQFGDQILSIAEQDSSSLNLAAAESYLASTHLASVQICDTPLSRLYILFRESKTEKWGFTFKSRVVKEVKPNSPASRAKLPVEWGIVDVNGVNTLLMETRDVARLIAQGTSPGLKVEGNVLELMVMPKSTMQEFQAYLLSMVGDRQSDPSSRSLLDVGAIVTHPAGFNVSYSDLRPANASLSWF